MAKGVVSLQKESGGITKISSADGAGVTEVIVPESGELVTKEYIDGLNSTNVKQSANLSDLSSSTEARTNLGLGTAATRDVGTASGNVMQVGAYGLGGVMAYGSSTDPNPTGFYYNLANAQAHGSGAFFLDVKYASGNYHGFRLSTDTYSNNIYWQAGVGGGAYGLRPRVMLHHTDNILHTTGSSTTFPMTQKSVTDALNTKVTKVASTDKAVVRFNGTTGELQDSGVTINDSGFLNAAKIAAGNNEDITPGIDGNGQVQIYGNGHTGYIALDSIGMHIGNASADRVLTFATNKTERMRIDTSGNLLLTSETGALGYGAGAGGTVTQLTSKSATVTLNKPCGTINTHNASLTAGGTIYFTFNNSLLRAGDGLLTNNSGWGAYLVVARTVINGAAYIYITNTGSAAGNVIPIQFQIIKGSNL